MKKSKASPAPTPRPRTESLLQVTVAPKVATKIRALSFAEGLSVSTWIRRVLLREIGVGSYSWPGMSPRLSSLAQRRAQCAASSAALALARAEAKAKAAAPRGIAALTINEKLAYLRVERAHKAGVEPKKEDYSVWSKAAPATEVGRIAAERCAKARAQGKRPSSADYLASMRASVLEDEGADSEAERLRNGHLGLN